MLTWKRRCLGNQLKSLQDYAVFLRRCCNAIEEMEYMQFDKVPNMKSIVFKLSYKQRETWCNRVYELQEERSRRVSIIDLVSFKKQARVASDPLAV